jgi:acyl carrier protein
MSTDSQVETILFESIHELNQELPENKRIESDRNTLLFGEKGGLDSLGLVGLIVAVEQKLHAEFAISVVLADEKAMSQRNSPFRTVDSLAKYIVNLLDASAAGRG